MRAYSQQARKAESSAAKNSSSKTTIDAPLANPAKADLTDEAIS